MIAGIFYQKCKAEMVVSVPGRKLVVPQAVREIIFRLKIYKPYFNHFFVEVVLLIKTS
mgnify:CR=1 FL=1